MVRMLEKEKVAVEIDVSSDLEGLDFGLDWAIKWGRSVRMDFRIVTASVCTSEVMALVRQCCLFGNMTSVEVME